MPTVMGPGITGLADDALRLAMQNGRSISGVPKISGVAAKSKAPKTQADIGSDEVAATAAAVSLSEMDRDTGPGTADRALEVSDKYLNIIGMVPFLGPVVVKFVAGAVGTVGGWVGLKSVQSFATKTKAGVVAVEEATFGSVAKKMGISGAVGGAAETAAKASAIGVDKISKVSGVGGFMSRRAFASAQGKFIKLGKHADALSISMLSDVHPELLSDVAALKTMTHGAVNVGHLNNEFIERVASVEAKMAELKTAGKQIASAPAVKQLERFVGSAGHTAQKLNASQGWLKPGEAVKNAPGNFSKTSVTHGVMNAAFITSSGVSLVTDARSFSKKVAMLKEMNYDLTGKRASTAAVLFGNVPEPVREARSAIMKTQVVKAGADLAGLASNLVMAFNSKVGMMKIMAAGMLPQFASQAVDSMVTDKLAVYTAFRHNALQKKAAHQKLTVEDYAPFIAELDRHLKAKGAVGQQFALKVAEHYVAIQASTGQVMKDIENGKVMSLVHKVIEDNEALTVAPAASQPETAAAIRHEATDRSDRPIRGRHSQRVVKETTIPGANLVRS